LEEVGWLLLLSLFGSVGTEMDDRRLQLEKAMDTGCA
jgi:hypothetical protein